MKKLPRSHEVDQALLRVRSAVGKVLKEINRAAGKAMTKGEYEAGAAIAERGREMMQFQGEVDVLRERWKSLNREQDGGTKTEVTPLWAYYQPVLQAVVDAGGECQRKDLEPFVERSMAKSFKAGDRVQMARGQARWQVMVRRTRKHLVAEGWLEDRFGPVWKITEAGRGAATNQLDGAVPTAES